MTYTIKRGDRPTFTDTLKANGVAINLTGCTVSLCIENTDTGLRYKRSATIVSASSGTVSYATVSNDTAVAGEHNLEWEIIDSGGKPQTVPSDGYIKLVILPDLG